jgi:hypothetical protein
MSARGTIPAEYSTSAVLSEDGRYRYRLDRTWHSGGRVLFVMLNPSTADATVDDPTIRRCIGFAKAWACGALTVVNLYAWRATKPCDLNGAQEPVGEFGPYGEGRRRENRNDVVIREAAAECGLRVIAWGSSPGPLQWRATRVVELLDETRWQGQRRKLYCLGETKAGHPRHPLYIPGDTQLVPWVSPR